MIKRIKWGENGMAKAMDWKRKRLWGNRPVVLTWYTHSLSECLWLMNAVSSLTAFHGCQDVFGRDSAYLGQSGRDSSFRACCWMTRWSGCKQKQVYLCSLPVPPVSCTTPPPPVLHREDELQTQPRLALSSLCSRRDVNAKGNGRGRVAQCESHASKNNYKWHDQHGFVRLWVDQYVTHTAIRQ